MTIHSSPATAPLPSIAVSGNGVMGQLVRKALESDPELSCHGCIGPVSNTPAGLLDSPSLSALPEPPAGIIDFSHPDCLSGLIDYVEAQLESDQTEASQVKAGCRIPVVIATTGYSDTQVAQIRELARRVPVVFSSNFSPGVTILTRVLRELAPLMADWDIEIVEKHHKRKLDAPSGTALTLANTITDVLPDRPIPIHAVRGGDIRGVHEVMFMGNGENLTLTHEALDRSLFAAGAIRAMKFALKQNEPGLWTMEDVIFSSGSSL